MRAFSVSITMLVLAYPPAAGAQVIEIAADGAQTVYSGPRLFTATASTPIEPDPDRGAVGPADDIAAVARVNGIAPGLLAAVAWQESRGRMDAVSPKGAMGIMQLMPQTAAALGVDPNDRAGNLRGGARYLRQQIVRFGSIPLALAAYNAGPGAIHRYGGIPPFRETRDYVAAVMARWQARGQAVLTLPTTFRESGQ